MTAAKAPIIAFVIPCYNEQAGIQHTLTYLLADMAKLEKSKIISPKSYVVLVDDGSTDQTWRLIERITHARPKRVRGLKLSRNVGHQNALLAGLLSQIGKADATISLDADLQDDMSVATKMVEHFNDGAEIVFAVRRNRPSDTWFKRSSADFFYRLINWLGAEVIPHHADFRLMSDRALRALARYGEAHVFLRGLAVQLGFKTATVTYDRLPRLHGETKYTLAKMVALAINGITSLSVRPIRMIPHGHHPVCGFPRNERLGLWHLGRGPDGPGLDLGDVAFPSDRLVPDLRDRRHRRVCRQDLFRDEGPTPLHCRRRNRRR